LSGFQLFRGAFPYFNLVQSAVFSDALQSDRSLVVSAPTGSGKTVVFELAIVRELLQRKGGQQFF
jgi:ATP-dependent DNA helicase HFM1/MER3